jgi:hypothetical protein
MMQGRRALSFVIKIPPEPEMGTMGAIRYQMLYPGESLDWPPASAAGDKTEDSGRRKGENERDRNLWSVQRKNQVSTLPAAHLLFFVTLHHRSR